MTDRHYCDEYTEACFQYAYERPLSEDHPRCEYCSDPLTEEEADHDGELMLCHVHGTVCDCCKEMTFNEDIRDGTSFHPEVKNLCIYCIEQVESGELDRDDIHP